ncbi:MAG: imelysin family protein [Hyphomicrobiales bacterium]
MISRRAFLAASLLLAFAGSVRAETEANIAITRELVTKLIIPNYEKLSQAAEAQAALWSSFAAKPEAAVFAGLRAAYLKTADAWSGVEFLHFGPAGVDFRFERMSYWPERKNATAKALTLLFAGKGDDGLAPEHFAGTSAAGQGLPALERLLFDDDAEKLLLAQDASGERRRQVGLAVARNIAIIAAQILAGWRDGADSALKKLDDPAYGQEATARIATDLLGLFQLIRDTKIEAPLGKSIESAKPRLAEGWRSGRSIRAIAVNLATLRDAVDIIFADSTDEISSPSVLKSAVKIADSLSSEDLSAIVTSPKQRSDAVLLYDAVTSARDVCKVEIPHALGITIGFNSLDGD